MEVLKTARREGRICSQCQWIITKKDWKKGARLCRGCTDANKGVNVRSGHGPDQNERIDRTGDMP